MSPSQPPLSHRILIATLFALLGGYLAWEATFPETRGRAFAELMLEEEFWLGIMPYVYHVGMVMGGMGLLINRNWSVLVSFAVAAMTVEEVFIGLISSQPVPFSISAQISLTAASAVAIGWTLLGQRPGSKSKHIGFRVLIVGISLSLVTTVLFEVFFGPHAIADPLVALLWLPVIFAAANGTSPLWLKLSPSLPRPGVALIVMARRPLAWASLIGLAAIIVGLGWRAQLPGLPTLLATVLTLSGWAACRRISFSAGQRDAVREWRKKIGRDLFHRSNFSLL